LFFVQSNENEIASVLALRRQPDIEVLLLWVVMNSYRGEGFLAAIPTEQIEG